MDLWTVAGAIGAILIVPVAIWAAWYTRQLRKPELLLSVVSTPLQVNSPRAAEGLGVSWNEVPVRNPWLVQVTIENVGTVDLASERFDRGRAIVLDLGEAETKALLGIASSTVWPAPTLETANGRAGSRIVFDANLVHPKEGFEGAFLVSGSPSPKWDHHLIDTTIRAERPMTGARRLADRASNVSAFLFIFGVFVTFIGDPSMRDPKEAHATNIAGSIGPIIAGAGVVGMLLTSLAKDLLNRRARAHG